MNRDNDLSAVLQQYAAETGVHSVHKVEQDFVAVAQQVPAEEVTDGLAQAMHSEQTPPFEDVLAESFARGDAALRSDMLRRLIEAAGHAVLKPLADHRILPPLPATEYIRAIEHVDDEAAQRLAPDAFRHIAREAVMQDPTVVDRMSEFYAVNPSAGRTLGGATLSVALSKMAEA